MSQSQPSNLALGDITLRHIDSVKPYWRNPRRVSDEAVNALAESIKSFGYQQPVVVDSDMTIIIGHTRYTALRRMGVEEIPILIADTLSQEEVKQLRVIDNRVSEFTSWDYDVLMSELEITDSQLMSALFPEKAVSTEFQSHDPSVTIDTARVVDEVDFVCPACFHSWETKVTKDAIIKGTIEVERK